jgi:glycosyltransferase involved in cell wall biosynthesis
MMTNKDFTVFILTHGRPDRLHTLRSLNKQGYTGRVIILIDNEDKTRDEYVKRYGDMVHVFDKVAISETFDEGDNFADRRAIIYARNACFEIAKNLGIRFFIELDDDYMHFNYRSDQLDRFCDKSNVSKLDEIFDLMIEFLQASNACSVAMAQNGDFIGGKDGNKAAKLKLWRKAMNTFVCDSTKPFQFFGRINEDVNVYTCGARRGMLFFTIPNVGICQKQTQSNKGGMTDLYLDSGTYVKSFYSVMYSPSCVKVVDMGPIYRRMHHRVSWKNCVPCILDESHKRK